MNIDKKSPHCSNLPSSKSLAIWAARVTRKGTHFCQGPRIFVARLLPRYGREFFFFFS